METRVTYKGQEITVAHCPKCGSEWLEVAGDKATRRAHVACPECGLMGPSDENPIEAVRRWNMLGELFAELDEAA